jgi:hypothetical protein
MSNTSYCRFQNTAQDLRDCYDNWDNEGLTEKEKRAQRKIFDICSMISRNYDRNLSKDDNGTS